VIPGRSAHGRAVADHATAGRQAGARGIARRWAGQRSIAAALVVAALLAVAGCSGDEPEPKPSGTPVPLPTGSAPAPERAAGGQPFGAHWDWARYDQFVPYLRKLEGSATYHELSWCDVEKVQGRPDWSAVDRVAQRSKELGIRLYLKIRIGVCWATGGTAQFTRGQANKTESAMPLDLAVYQKFVGDLVRRYAPQGVKQYAIENEVNAQQYWAGTPQEYTRLVTAAAEAIHGADPDAKVVDSGISSVAYGFGVVDRLLRVGQEDAAVAAYRDYFERRVGTRGRKIPAVDEVAALRTALADETNARNLAYLAATEGLLDSGVVQVRQVHYYEHPDGVPALLDYLRAETPAGVPLQAWEVGQFWRDGGDDAAGRADEVVKVTAHLLAGGITEVMWLPLGYNPNNRAGAEVRYGLLEPDGTEREAGRMLAALAAAARDATVSGVARGGLTGLAFQRGGESTVLVWSASGSSVSVPAAPGLHSGPVGGELTPTSAAVSVSATPLLLRAPGTPDTLLAGVG
jgi:hypothetical protein